MGGTGGANKNTGEESLRYRAEGFRFAFVAAHLSAFCFAVTWMGITCVCLLYTATVTPAVISFHWLDEPCDVVPTLPIDWACWISISSWMSP